LATIALSGCRYLEAPPSPSTVSASDSTGILWAGGVTDTSARVTARLAPAAESLRGEVRLQVDTDSAFASPRTVAPGGAGDRPAGVPRDPAAITFPLSGLSPGTSYHYRLVRKDGPMGMHGRFRTFETGAHSFRVAIGSCASTGSRHPVFDVIRRSGPDLMLHVGDLHYEDIRTPRLDAFRRAYADVHASPEQAALYRSVPIAYVWDDHDYGPNNSSRRSPAQDVAQTAYRTYVPHYPLAEKTGTRPIHQAFSIGRVRFLITDLRSARNANDLPDSPQKTMMGEEQKAWFKRELARARAQYPVVVWVSSVPWISDDSNDRWSGFAYERRELARYIDSIGVADQLVVASGDAHMVAFDDGTNNEYGRPGGGRFPVVHAGALDRRGSVKGGPYTHGPYPNRFSLRGANDGQFVQMDVRDDGDGPVCITWTGKRWAYDDERVVTLDSLQQCFPPVDARDR
jgi:alkaline phosphatase D